MICRDHPSLNAGFQRGHEAEGIHFVDDLRVFRVMLIGINETANSVELCDLTVHLAEEKSQKTNKNDE